MRWRMKPRAKTLFLAPSRYRAKVDHWSRIVQCQFGYSEMRTHRDGDVARIVKWRASPLASTQSASPVTKRMSAGHRV